MKLAITEERKIGELQDEFNHFYPFLRLELIFAKRESFLRRPIRDAMVRQLFKEKHDSKETSSDEESGGKDN